MRRSSKFELNWLVLKYFFYILHKRASLGPGCARTYVELRLNSFHKERPWISSQGSFKRVFPHMGKISALRLCVGIKFLTKWPPFDKTVLSGFLPCYLSMYIYLHVCIYIYQRLLGPSKHCKRQLRNTDYTCPKHLAMLHKISKI
jgi:hypothetical protein